MPDNKAYTWGLELYRWGKAGTEHVITGQAQVSHNSGRVNYDWDVGLREWFVNDTRGLEQGWTLLRAPRDEGQRSDTVVFELTVLGNLNPQVATDGASVHFVDAQGNTTLNYGGLKAWDADCRTLPARFEVIDGNKAGLRVSVETHGASYPITVDPYVQQAHLTASNPGTGDQFGYSVSVSGDTVVVGAIGEDSGATGVNGNEMDNSAPGSGAAYVFVRTGHTWSQQAYLKASNTDAGDSFGYSVSVSGDTIVVGAYLEDSNATGVNGDQAYNSFLSAGAIYVYVRSGGVWSQQAYLKASNTGYQDYFGWSVAVSDNTIVVGAPAEDSSATGVNGTGTDTSSSALSGAAYIFERSGGTWSQQAYLKAHNSGGGDEFGESVSISGDTVVVGAEREDSNATGVNGDHTNNSVSAAGAAYVYVRSGGMWSQQAYLKASNTEVEDQFGHAVAISGDTIVVGTNQEDSNATGVNGDQTNNSALASGAAYVFVRESGAWSQQAYLKPPTTVVQNRLGWSVSVSGNTVVAGTVQIGSAYVFAVSCSAPVITTQPQGVAEVCNGAQASFSVTATGTGPLSYQWQKNGADIPGATGDSYSIDSVTVDDADSYTVIVTNACGSVTSDAASLTLESQPPIISCPLDISVAGNIFGSCEANLNVGMATATDNCSITSVTGVRSDGLALNVPYLQGMTTITWTATDTTGNPSSCPQTVTVTNSEPVATITGPATGSVYAIGTAVDFTGSFTDNAGGAHTATWAIDSTEVPGAIEGYVITGSHIFTMAGVYKVSLTLDDGCGGSHTTDVIEPDSMTMLVVIYDPGAGWVTGGGWINSPAGAYVEDPALTGKANFGFVSRYKNGASVPIGSTDFYFKAGDLKFQSTAYEWMIISGARVQYKGSGMINDAGDYRFMLTAIDGKQSGGGGQDKFRLRRLRRPESP